MKSGRKRKNGRRTPAGRLSRAGIPVTYDRGTERVQAMQAIYGQDGCDAIGRAYRKGLLGQGNEAKAMLDIARSISNAYWAAYANGKITSAIGDKSGGTVTNIDDAREWRREKLLNEHLAFVRTFGTSHRKAFYELVIDINPDCGPRWLDRLCAGTVHDPDDKLRLSAAIETLSALIA